jgi:hypothetical protein
MLIITTKMQCNTIFFIAVKALNFSGGFPAHHQDVKNCTHSIWYVPGLLLPPLAAILAVPDAVCTVLHILMMGGETA